MSRSLRDTTRVKASSQRRDSRGPRHGADGKNWGLPPDHPAVLEGRTRYPASLSLKTWPPLKSGFHNTKIGRVVTKGKWAGMPIFTLTLEERYTCPDSCAHWRDCFVPGSRVLKDDFSWVAIETLAVGDRICAFKENREGLGRRLTQMAIVEKVGRAVQPCYRITTNLGVVVVSAKHLWLRRRSRLSYRWLETDKLKVGDKLQFFAEPWQQDRSYDAGRLRGFVEGEGTCGTHSDNGFLKSRVGWSQRPTKLCDEIFEMANRLGFKVARYARIAGVRQTAITHTDVKGGWKEVVRFLGRIRPTRMIEKAEKIWVGHDPGGRAGRYAVVEKIEYVGPREVVTIQTSTGTMIAEGFFTHNCYGNKMPFSSRQTAGPELEIELEEQLLQLSRDYRRGFVVRLHVLGDFYSPAYVGLWHSWLERFPQLHVFGYSAWPRASQIGQALALIKSDRWHIRLSNARGPNTTAVVDHADLAPAGSIVCPAQIAKTECCATCALCWETTKPITFIKH